MIRAVEPTVPVSRLEALLDQPAAGLPVVLIGPPRCGRSTLLQDVVDRLRDAGGAVLATRAIRGDRGRPLATVQRLVSAWVAASHGTASLRATRGLVGLNALAPELGPVDGPADPTRLQAEGATLLRRLLQQGSVLLAVDDAHLADAASLALLRALLASAPGEPVALLLSWCPEEAVDPGLVHAQRVLLPARDPGVDDADLRPRCAARLARLDADARHVLALLAVADQAVDAEHLAAAADLGDHLDPALDALEAAGWLTAHEAGPALQLSGVPGWMAAVRSTLSVRRRRQLHAAWLRAPLPASQALSHTRAAGTAADAQAVGRLRQAGLEAMDARDFERARNLLETAHTLAERREGSDASLLRALGGCRRFTGDLDGAEAAWVAALDAEPEPGTRTHLYRELAMLAWDQTDVRGAFAWLDAGWEALEGVEGAAAEALVRTELIFRDRQLDMDGLRETAQRLEAIARSPDALSELCQCRASLALFEGDMERAMEQLQRASALAEDAAEHRVRMRAAHGLNMSAISLGRPLEVLGRLGEAVVRGPYAATAACFARLQLGDIAGLEAMESAFDPGSDWRHLLLVSLVIPVLRGGEPDLESIGFHPGESTIDRREQAFGIFFLAASLASAGKHDEVRRRIRASGMVRRDGVAGPLPYELARMLGTACARTGHPDEAEEVAALIEHHGPYASENAAVIRSELAIAAGDPAGPRALAACAEAFDARSMAPLAARTRLDAACASTDPEVARPWLDGAWPTLVALGASRDLARARERYAALGLDVPATPRRGATEGPLSVRELEVVRQVARGLTNRQVAKALFISPSTVATHLKRVYRRLGVHNRAAVTRWAAEHGHLS